MRSRLVFNNGSVYKETFERIDKTGKTGDNGWFWVKGLPFVVSSIDLFNLPVIMINTTFGQFWQWLISSPKVVEFIDEFFRDEFTIKNFKAYIDEFDSITHPSGTYPNDELFNLRVCRTINKSTFNGETDIEIGYSFDGWGKWPKIADEEKESYGGIAVEFIPINQFRDIPLIIEDEIIFTDFDKLPEPCGKIGKAELTILNIVQAIISEITWH